MLKASKEYKEMMNKPIRQRGYATVSLGVVNQSAQGDATTDFGEVEYYSKGSILDANQSDYITYATYEDNFIKADGKTVFAPRNTVNAQIKDNGVTVSQFNATLRIDFGKSYDIKGLTIQFAPNAHAVDFDITGENGTLNIRNNADTKFVTEENFGATSYLIIKPIKFYGARQRWHIQTIMFGVGFVFTNALIEKIDIDSHISALSSEVSYENMKISVFDKEKKFDVDNPSSFMSYLEPFQPIGISFGVDLEDGTQEWLKTATGYLKEWNSKDGKLSLSATDKLSQLDAEYTLGNVIQERTAYSEFEKILTDCGIEADNYYIDDYLYSFTLKNPIGSMTHREALQLLANATRCVIFEDENGVINVKANFETVIDPETFVISATNADIYSNVSNVMKGQDVINYVDLTTHNFKLDGQNYLLSTDGNYLSTGYVSYPSNSEGKFDAKTSITIELPALYSYYGLTLSFGGAVPSELKITTYKNDTLLESFTHDNLTEECELLDNFIKFNKLVVEFIETEAYARVQVNKISFGNATDYALTKSIMLDAPTGTMDEIVKEVRVKIHTYELDEDNNPKLVEDNVYYTYPINSKGVTKTCENPLISNENQAKALAEWSANYFKNNVSYSISYRGDPRVQPSDIVRVENDYKNNMQVEIQTAKLSFDGAFSGQLECRRALDMIN